MGDPCLTPRWHHRASRCSPATRAVYTRALPCPQFQGATQTHFRARPRHTAWHSNITDELRHTVRQRQMQQWDTKTRRVYTCMFPMLQAGSLRAKTSRSPAKQLRNLSPSREADGTDMPPKMRDLIQKSGAIQNEHLGSFIKTQTLCSPCQAVFI